MSVVLLFGIWWLIDWIYSNCHTRTPPPTHTHTHTPFFCDFCGNGFESNYVNIESTFSISIPTSRGGEFRNKNRSRNSFLGKLLSRRLQYENYQYIPISRFENRLVFIVSSVWVYGRDIIHGCGLNSVASPCERSLCALFFDLCSVVQMCSCFESHSYWSNSVRCT